MTVRLAHFSDIHVSANPIGWRRGDWLTKRVSGWINTHWRSRRWRFAQAAEVVERLVADVHQRQPDALVFSGDATMLGFPAELTRAAALLNVADARTPGIAVPGNHDYYIARAERSGDFERTFAPWQVGERVDSEPYPFARQVGHVWLIGVNSAVGNRVPWDARGQAGAPQLRRLATLLERLPPGPRVLVTHYPVANAAGEPEGEWHRLRDLISLQETASAGNVNLWLHGHRHDAYRLAPRSEQPFPVICAGSATEAGRWGYHEYAIDGFTLHGVRRSYDPNQRGFRDETTFTLELQRS